MDDAGVDKTVMLVADFTSRLGEGTLSIEEENRLVFEAYRRYPDRIIPFFGIDPRKPEAADSFERGIKVWGAKGFKLHSSVGSPHTTRYAILSMNYVLPTVCQ